jgi:hypothetical protein
MKIKAGITISLIPWFLALGLYYSLAIHMYHSLGGWPKSIGTRGFSSALLMHNNIHGFYISNLALFTIFVVPVIIFICLFVPRWRYLVIYLSLQLLGMLVFFLQMFFAPDGYTNWWLD